MKKSVCTIAMIGLLSASGQVLAAEGSQPGDNAVQVEMRLLDKAFKNAVDGLLLNMPEIIEGPFHKVHKAKMNTEKAIKKGAIKLPKNSDKLNEFVELDEAFHEKLVGLLKASRKKDMNAVKNSIHEIMDGCVQCHNKFKN
ncbi:MAG: cytochrome c [Proteobacteria bacterium]|nr:cytochrome c [Pseudomonadota bacterium]